MWVNRNPEKKQRSAAYLELEVQGARCDICMDLAGIESINEKGSKGS